MLRYALIVTRPFGTFRRGDMIEGGQEIDSVLNSEHARFVVRVAINVSVARGPRPWRAYCALTELLFSTAQFQGSSV